MKIRLGKPVFFGEEVDEIKSVLESGWWTQGPRVLEFEREFAKFVGIKHALAVNSGTAALHLALCCCSDDFIVAVPDFTFPSVANSALILGRELKLLDVDLDTFNIGETSEAGCIVPTHVFGNPCKLDKIEAQFVIEDAACGIGSYYKGKHVGTFGDVGCFSFHPRKLLPVGVGGMLVTDSDEIAYRARILREDGRKNKHKFVIPGYNFRISDVIAAIGLVQIKHFPETLSRRREQAEFYDKLISEFDVPVVPQKVLRGCLPNYQSYVVRLHRNSREVIKEMAEKEIETQIGTYALHLQPTFAFHPPLQNSKILYETTLTLPLYHELSKENQVYVIKSLKKVLSQT